MIPLWVWIVIGIVILGLVFLEYFTFLNWRYLKKNGYRKVNTLCLPHIIAIVLLAVITFLGFKEPGIVQRFFESQHPLFELGTIILSLAYVLPMGLMATLVSYYKRNTNL